MESIFQKNKSEIKKACGWTQEQGKWWVNLLLHVSTVSKKLPRCQAFKQQWECRNFI